MSLLYKRIHELESELALSLAHNLAVDKTGNAKATKSLLSELSTLIDTDIRAGIIADAVTQTIAQLEAAGQIAKAGNIKSHGSNILQDGWLWCDNASYERVGTYADLFADIGTTWGSVDGAHFNVPEFRGIALMGAGSSAKLVDANGAAFARVLGTYQNDKMHNHIHGIGSPTGYSSGSATLVVSTAQRTNFNRFSGNPLSSGSGTPRTGAETNPANAGVNFIIKY